MKHKTTQNNTHAKMYTSFIRISLIMLVLLTVLTLSFAELELNRIYTDPAIITAGDEVDIVVQYEAKNTFMDSNRVGDSNYEFRASLVLEDDVSKEHITLLDSQGLPVRGSILSGVTYNEVFRIKVSPEAPAATYKLKLEGQWYKDGSPIGGTEFKRFDLDIKKEGIILDIGSIESSPSKIRPGDEAVELQTFIENSGFKDAKSVELRLNTNNSLIVPTFSDNNRNWVGIVANGSSKPTTFTLDFRESLSSGVYNVSVTMNYKDFDNNEYAKVIDFPIRIDSRPNLEIVNTSGISKIGDSSQLEVYIKNTGEDTAESVDARIIKDASQPFAMDIRSDYLGEIKPGETRKAIFSLETLDSADEKTHSFKILMRAQGDREKGDTSIYTYYGDAEFEVSGTSTNWFVIIGTVIVVIVLIAFIGTKWNNTRKNQNKKIHKKE